MTGTSREQLRAERLARLSPWYSPWFHLAVPALGGIAIAATALSRIHDLRAWQLAFVPLFLVFGNAVEWHAHRGLLHRRTRFLEVLYVQHTPQHHAIFTADDMSIRSAREMSFVLLPAFGVFAILAIAAPVAVAVALLGQSNIACLWVASTTLYVLSYEWLHLTYHLPEDHVILRIGVIRILRRHHQRHHAPQLMQRWNFNVTVPLWDIVRGTVYRPHAGPTLAAVGSSRAPR